MLKRKSRIATFARARSLLSKGETVPSARFSHEMCPIRTSVLDSIREDKCAQEQDEHSSP